jgi:hypothetical protein
MTDITGSARGPECGICDFKTVYIVTTYTSDTELRGTPVPFGKYDSERDARQALADDGFTNGQFGWRKNTYTDATISKSVEYSNHRADLAPDPLADARVAALEWMAAHKDGIIADVKTAHRDRGAGASDWMREDDREFLAGLRAALASITDTGGRKDG